VPGRRSARRWMPASATSPPTRAASATRWSRSWRWRRGWSARSLREAADTGAVAEAAEMAAVVEEDRRWAVRWRRRRGRSGPGRMRFGSSRTSRSSSARPSPHSPLAYTCRMPSGGRLPLPELLAEVLPDSGARPGDAHDARHPYRNGRERVRG
jgi:hypothetical protein